MTRDEGWSFVAEIIIDAGLKICVPKALGNRCQIRGILIYRNHGGHVPHEMRSSSQAGMLKNSEFKVMPHGVVRAWPPVSAGK